MMDLIELGIWLLGFGIETRLCFFFFWCENLYMRNRIKKNTGFLARRSLSIGLDVRDCVCVCVCVFLIFGNGLRYRVF